ncbi:MAG: PqqD family protein [Acidimicrobiia bacterium]|nr:PqqD family protein [Acidimicrobiia bacterium]
MTGDSPGDAVPGDAVIDDAFVPRPRAEVAWVELDGEGVVYEPRSETLHRLNATATAVWRGCDGSAPVSAIVTALVRSYSGDAGEIARQVREVVQSFGALGLLEGIEPAVPAAPLRTPRPYP